MTGTWGIALSLGWTGPFQMGPIGTDEVPMGFPPPDETVPGGLEKCATGRGKFATGRGKSANGREKWIGSEGRPGGARHQSLGAPPQNPARTLAAPGLGRRRAPARQSR